MRAITVYAPKPAGMCAHLRRCGRLHARNSAFFERHLPTLRGNLQGMRYRVRKTQGRSLPKNVQRFAESALMYASAWPLERSSGESTMCTL